MGHYSLPEISCEIQSELARIIHGPRLPQLQGAGRAIVILDE
jgi:hypothetical protein